MKKDSQIFLLLILSLSFEVLLYLQKKSQEHENIDLHILQTFS